MYFIYQLQNKSKDKNGGICLKLNYSKKILRQKEHTIHGSTPSKRIKKKKKKFQHLGVKRIELVASVRYIERQNE